MRLLLSALVCSATLAAGERSLAEDVIDEDCQKFHQECTEAKAQGYSEAGICNVERLECKLDPASEPAAGVGKRRRDASDTRGSGPTEVK